MAISDSYAPISYVGDGSTKDFAVNWPYRDPADLVVVVTDLSGVATTKVYNSDYTVASTQDTDTFLYTGGTVSFVVAPTVAFAIKITRATQHIQSTEYTQDNPFPHNSHEAALDILTMIAQELAAQNTDHSIVFPDTETVAAGANVLPAAATRASKALVFDSSGVMGVAPLLGFNPRSNWTTATAYSVNDWFLNVADGVTYVTLIAHTSSTIAADLAALKIKVFVPASITTLTTVADYADDGGPGVDDYRVTIASLTTWTKGIRIATIIAAAHTNTGACTLKLNALVAKSIKLGSGANPAAGQLVAGTLYVFYYDGTNVQVLNPTAVGTAGSATVNPYRTEARVTLESGVPISTTDQSAKTHFFITKFKGAGVISVYSGGAWIELTLPAGEIDSGVLTLTNGKNYDIFVWNNAGVLDKELIVWTDDTNRATALAVQDGVYVKNGDATRKYIGTIRASAANQVSDTAAQRYVWNEYNRLDRELVSPAYATASWTYSNATFQQVNGAAANKVECVVGRVEDLFEALAQGSASSTTGAEGIASGVGVNSTSTNSAQKRGGYVNTGSNTSLSRTDAHWLGFARVGYNAFNWLESGHASGTTWFGTNGSMVAGLMARGKF